MEARTYYPAFEARLYRKVQAIVTARFCIEVPDSVLNIFAPSVHFRVVRSLPLHLLKGDAADLSGDRSSAITHYTKFRPVVIAAGPNVGSFHHQQLIRCDHYAHLSDTKLVYPCPVGVLGLYIVSGKARTSYN